MTKKTTLIFIIIFAFALSISTKADEINTGIPEDAASCAAGIDNDMDGLTGVFGDPDCEIFETIDATSTATTTEDVATTTATTTVEVAVEVEVPAPALTGGSIGAGSSGGFSGGSITSGTPVSAIISSTTLPVATSTSVECSDSFKTYMKKGGKNDSNEVKKLQKFLNVKETGFFGNLTENAVKAFQIKHKDTILAPWGLTKATGYFHKMTQKQANILLCSVVK